MAHIVILGAGIGGMNMAYEMREQARAEDRVTVISNLPYFQFTPSNPWVAVNWRKQEDITIPVAPYLNNKNIDFIAVGAARVHPERNQLELTDGQIVDYDYLVIATGPKLAFDEVPGLGPEGHTQSVCQVEHATAAARQWDKFVQEPGPIVVGAVQGASCYGPAYEFAFIMDTDLRKRKIRDRVPMTYVTAEPYIGHLGLGGVGDSKGLLESAMRERHIKWICNAKVTKVEAGKMFVAEHNDKGEIIKEHELPFAYSMMLPAFKGIDAVFGIDADQAGGHRPALAFGHEQQPVLGHRVGQAVEKIAVQVGRIAVFEVGALVAAVEEVPVVRADVDASGPAEVHTGLGHLAPLLPDLLALLLLQAGQEVVEVGHPPVLPMKLHCVAQHHPCLFAGRHVLWLCEQQVQ